VEAGDQRQGAAQGGHPGQADHPGEVTCPAPLSHRGERGARTAPLLSCRPHPRSRPMTLRRTLLLLGGLALLAAALRQPASAYVEERYTLPRVINESTNIILLKVEKVNKERKLIYYKKLADIKGKHPTDVIKHNLSVG